jgi:hypothetical protein
LLAASFLPPENLGKSDAPFRYRFEEVYERDQGLESLESLSLMRQVKTLFLTESNLPLVQLWGGRLEFNGFTGTLHIQNPTTLPAASFLMSENSGKSGAHFSSVFAGTYEREEGLDDLQNLSQIRETKSVFLTQSSLPLVQIWGGRLELDGFTSTLQMQDVQFGPSAAGRLQDFRPPRQGYPGIPRSVSLYGVSLSFRFGRDAHIGPIWRRLARIGSAIR